MTIAPVTAVLHSPVTAAVLASSALAPDLHALLLRFAAAEQTNLGYPAATDIDYTPLVPFLRHMVNNVGDPRADPTYPIHAMDVERKVLAWAARLFRASAGWTGYLTAGSSEGTLHNLRLARDRLPDAVVYHSRAAHYSVPKAAQILRLPTAVVEASEQGVMDYADLRAKAGARRGRSAIVVATIGTTVTEAVDSVPEIQRALDGAGVQPRWIHADAALAGIPLALTGRRGFDLAAGADSIVVSGHKWFGTPIPCGIALTAHQPLLAGRHISYIGNHDSTIAGSRAGLAAILLWHAITGRELHEHRLRAEQARDVAAYACDRLDAIGWPNWRTADAVTVVLRALPEVLHHRWPLPLEQGWSHVICMPGTTTQHIDHLVDDLQGVC
jgi:histidine decarboxylase